MKAYKIELLVVDHDNMSLEEVKDVIESQRYPNYCISPSVMHSESADIGEWDDDHPLNSRLTHKEEYDRLFYSKVNYQEPTLKQMITVLASCSTIGYCPPSKGPSFCLFGGATLSKCKECIRNLMSPDEIKENYKAYIERNHK